MTKRKKNKRKLQNGKMTPTRAMLALAPQREINSVDGHD